jgi:mannitol/fructose-specific phosphotransferase system IIA component (Ntr-type)
LTPITASPSLSCFFFSQLNPKAILNALAYLTRKLGDAELLQRLRNAADDAALYEAMRSGSQAFGIFRYNADSGQNPAE